MSTTVDQRVVEMQFDNKQFEQNVSTTMSSLDKLKQSLNLTGAAKGLESVGTAARGINLSGLTNAAETVGLKFNAMWTIADQALRNITNTAVNAGERILSALTIDPIKTGLQEYETQINAVQTILANTESKGTTLNDVNGALDTLNEYADKTIYNFTEMTRNIGTFTAAGVDLDTSVNAIQGIANLAAVSGSSSQQASTAMYQLSQALSSGTVKLMDWNSVVNAGMGGQVFQDALKETARVHGIAIDEMIEENGSFRETLQEGWLTADILTETLSHFTMAAEEGSKQWNEYKKSLMDSGYSEEQANAILKLSNTATDAATKVKTATQLFDTLKETAQSGWTQTWEIIFGDFEEAKSLFSELYETLSPLIEASSKARNELLEGWAKAGGRADMLESMRNLFEGIGNVVKPIKEAFREIFPATTVKQLTNLSDGIKNLTERFKNFFAEGSDNAANLKTTFKGLFAALDIVKMAFKAVFDLIKPLFGGVGDLSGGILGLTAKFGDWVIRLRESIIEGNFFGQVIEKIRSAFEKVKNFIRPAIDGFKQFADAIGTNVTAALGNAQERLGPLAAIGNLIKAIFVGLGNAIKTVFPYVSAAASGIGKVLGDLMGRITNSIQNADYDSFFDLISGGLLTTIGVFIAKFIKSGSNLVDNAGGFVDSIKGILEGAGDALGAFTDSLKADTLKKIATAIAILAASLLVLSLIPSERLSTALVSITALFGELMGSMAIFNKMGDMKNVGKIAAAMVTLASSVLILSVALKIMSTMSLAEMGVGLISLTVGIGELVGAVFLLSKMPEKELKSSVKAIKNLASALLILSVALKVMGSMSWEEMGVALISMTVGLAALVGAIYLLPKDTALRAAGMIGLAAAMVILGGALKIMSTMSWGEVAVSLVALAGSLAILAIAMNLMMGALPGALAMLVVSPALLALAAALKVMATLSWEDIGRGLTALGGSLAILAVGLTLMLGALPGAAALLVAAGALAILTPVLMALGSMSLGEIGKSLLMIAGVFAIFGVAGLVLAPLVPVILALSGALALFGAACALVGVGVLALGAGLIMISAAGSAAALSLVTIVSSIISLIPYLIEQIGVGIIKLCEVIAGSADAICEAVKVIILAVVDALVVAVPPLVEGILVIIVSLLESLIDHLPTIVTHLVTLFVKLMALLVEHVPTLVEGIFTLWGAIIESVAANITRLVQPLVKLVTAIVQGVADAIGPIIETVIAPIIQLLTDILSSIATVINSVAVAIAVALNGLAAVFDSVLNGIANVITSVGESIKSIFEGIGTTIESVGTAIEDSLNGLSGVFDSVFNGISDVVTSVGDSIKNVLDGIAGVIDSIGEAALNAGTGFENLAKGVKIITELKLVDMVASLTAVAGGIGKIAKHSNEIQDVGSGMAQIASSASTAASSLSVIPSIFTKMTNTISSVETALENLSNAFTAAASTMQKAGVDLLDKVISGINSQKEKLGSSAKDVVKLFTNAIDGMLDTAKSSCVKLVSICANAISSKAGLFTSAGKDLVNGFANGISANRYKAAAQAKAMAAAAANAARKELDEHSPSRVGYGIGDFFGIAFVNAIADNVKKAYDTSAKLANAAGSGLKNAFDKVSRIISGEVDVNPTIKPVLDLTNVRSGANAINGMLGLQPSVGVLANIGAVSSMMNLRGQTASNDDVVYAINKLRRELGNIGNTSYYIDGITYDDGSNIADAVQAIARAALRERRV